MLFETGDTEIADLQNARTNRDISLNFFGILRSQYKDLHTEMALEYKDDTEEIYNKEYEDELMFKENMKIGLQVV